MKFKIAYVSIFCLLLGVSAFGSEAPRSVTVTGACTRNILPDRGALVVTVEAKDADSKRAQVAATRQYEGVRAKISSLHLKDGELTTVEYRSEEIREWEKDRVISKGFRTRMSLRVETSDHARLGEVIDIASREGIRQIGALQHYVSPKKTQEEKISCLKEASEQAKEKAESLAKALGVRVGEPLQILEINDPNSQQPVPMLREVMAMKSSADAAPRIEPGKIELTTLVSVTFGLK